MAGHTFPHVLHYVTLPPVSQQDLPPPRAPGPRAQGTTTARSARGYAFCSIGDSPAPHVSPNGDIFAVIKLHKFEGGNTNNPYGFKVALWASKCVTEWILSC